MSTKIDKGNSFNTVDEKIGLQEYKNAVEYYFKHFESAIKLENKIPIFLDTNVLLRFYSISFKQRELLQKFFEQRKKQIILSKQVQKEFIKNREEVIEKYFQTALGGLSQQFESEVINRVTQFREEHKEIIKDFEFLEEEMVNYKPKLEEVLEELRNEIEEKRKQNKLIKFEDATLDIFASFQQLENLTEQELNFLKEEFDSLKKGIDPQKIKAEIKKPNAAFPGMGDIQEKPKNPYGDYYLFHEMIKYSKENDKDVVFLTYDITKGDWLKTNKEPHMHYIQKVFQISNRSIFIIDANSFFETLFSTSFDSLIPESKRIDYYSVESDLEKEVIIGFIGLERIIRTIAEYVIIDEDRRMPISKIVKEFYDRDYITEETLNELRKLINIKNELVHRDKEYVSNRYGEPNLSAALRFLDKNIELFNNLYSIL